MKYRPISSLRDFNAIQYEERPRRQHSPLKWALIAMPVIALAVLSLPANDANALRSQDKVLLQQIQTGNAELPLPEIKLTNTAASSNPQKAAIVTAKAIEPAANKPAVVEQIVTNNPTDSQQTWSTVTVAKGDSLAKIFARKKIPANHLHKIMRTGPVTKKLANIKPGQTLNILSDEETGLIELIYAIDSLNTIKITRKDEQFSSQLVVEIPDKHTVTHNAIINDSLFLAAQSVDLPEKITMELANIFGWDIDFALDIRKNDAFTVAYEELFVNGKKIGVGNILAAEFVSRGKSHHAIRFADPKGNVDYYNTKGQSLRKAFIRTPVDFSRISSGFSTGRKHPVLNRIRAHKGVDYAARSGTPIRATGRGKIVFRGKKGGYGNTLVIKHGSAYSTLYAHLSKFKKGLRSGARVKQGQIIGYVGKTGLATGPHLHYEFRVNGVHRNPLTVKLPSAKPLPGKYKKSFEEVAATSLALLQSTKDNTLALQEQ
ncbi:MAG: peptidoglycan DD-metalloendopeptidase family protein [Gammaproteobacteria bacterium]